MILLDGKGAEVLRWNLFEAWPSRWDGPTLDAMTNNVVIESLTITCESQEQVTS